MDVTAWLAPAFLVANEPVPISETISPLTTPEREPVIVALFVPSYSFGVTVGELNVRTLRVTVKVIVTVRPVWYADKSVGVKVAVRVEDPTPLAV